MSSFQYRSFEFFQLILLAAIVSIDSVTTCKTNFLTKIKIKL